MTLLDPSMVYGFVIDEQGYVSGATVDIVSNNYQGFERVITSDVGYYQINIQDIATEGDTVKISIVRGSGGASSEFILDTSNLYERADFNFRYNVQTDVNNVSINISGQWLMIKIYTVPECEFCDKAKKFFSKRNIEFEEINLKEKEILF